MMPPILPVKPCSLAGKTESSLHFPSKVPATYATGLRLAIMAGFEPAFPSTVRRGPLPASGTSGDQPGVLALALTIKRAAVGILPAQAIAWIHAQRLKTTWATLVPTGENATDTFCHHITYDNFVVYSVSCILCRISFPGLPRTPSQRWDWKPVAELTPQLEQPVVRSS